MEYESSGTSKYLDLVSKAKKFEMMAEVVRPQPFSNRRLGSLLKQKAQLEAEIIKANTLKNQEDLLDVKENIRQVCHHKEKDNQGFCMTCGLRRERIADADRAHYNELMKEAKRYQKLAEKNKPVDPPSESEWEELKKEAKQLREVESKNDVINERLDAVLTILQKFCTHSKFTWDMEDCPVCYAGFQKTLPLPCCGAYSISIGSKHQQPEPEEEDDE